MSKDTSPKNNNQIRSEEVEQLFRNNLSRIVPVDLDQEMRKSFIDYAMSVITDRALPDIRDGLKPVHRRILYSMYTQGFTPDKSFRKCATTVGVVLGKFHPHGDAAVYDAMVRLAQDFSMRHTLVEGYGNFGSRDGDPPAAYRYTEARLETISMEMLRDINKDAVDFKPNYDEHEMEPTVLPSRFPNLLVNGSTGIAVGMATNIPPHNLSETINAVIYLMKNKEAELDNILEYLKGPDFPTGGTIIGTYGIKQAYQTGRGRIVVRGNAEIEDMPGNRQRIVVRDLPYMVNKARLIEKIAELSKDKKIEGISFVRDESDRKDPVRIVIELKREANPHVVLNQLYKTTQLQDTFSVNLLALVPDEKGRYEPKTLTLMECLHHYIKHQKEVVLRRTQFDLDRAKARQHLLEGLKIAFIHIDEIIKTIKEAKSPDLAKESLMAKFGFSERQAQHIGDMRLFRLTNLEQVKIETEYSEVTDKIEYYNDIINKEDKLIEVIETELLEISKKYGDDRRTAIDINADEDIEDESLIQEKSIVITMTKLGYIKRQLVDTYKAQKRGGIGISGMTTREEDYVQTILTGSTHSTYLFLTNTGRVFRLKGYQIPDAGRQAKGTNIVNLLELNENEKVKTILPVETFDIEADLILVTTKGLIKKTTLSDYAKISKAGLIAISLKEEDSLIGADIATPEDEIIIGTSNGYSVRFQLKDVRPTARNTQGVRGIKLKPKDKVIGMTIVKADKTLLVVSENGYGKKTTFAEYGCKNRGGIGIKTYKTTEKTGRLISLASVSEEQDILLLTDEGTLIRINIAGIPLLSRVTQGVTLMKTKNGQVVDMAIVEHEDEPTEE